MLLFAWISSTAFAADGLAANPTNEDAQWEKADVVVDGHVILSVRGISGYPAQRRAAEIRQRIIAIAGDDEIAPGDVTIDEMNDSMRIMIGDRIVLHMFDLDAEIEGIDRKLLAETVQLRLQETITD